MTLQQIIDKSNSIVFFGGAGVSTASGIPDFRSADGLYNQTYKMPPEYMLSSEYFWEHTEEFYDFYRDRMLYPNAKPNACHIALAKMEETGKLKAVITQNIDGLHQSAGSKSVYEFHGSVLRNYCVKCRKEYAFDFVLHSTGVPKCSCGGIVKPDVVLYGEGIDEHIMTDSVQMICNADTLIVGGTSLNVYPAAGLIRYFKGRHLVLINKTPTQLDSSANLLIKEDIAKVFGELKI